MITKIQNTIENVDLFSKQFQFSVGLNKNQKTTIIGGLMSLFIILASLFYFVYLLYLYFDNQIQPKITSSSSVANKDHLYEFSSSFFAFQMIVDGYPLSQFEQKQGKKYLQFLLYCRYQLDDGSFIFNDVRIQECEDNQIGGFLCPNKEDLQNFNILQVNLQKRTNISYGLKVDRCRLPDNCASDDEINNLLVRQPNYFSLQMKIEHYDYKLKKYVYSYKPDYFYFDPSLLNFTRINLIKGTTTVTSGLLIQSNQSDQLLTDYKKSESNLTQDYISKRFKFDGFCYISFELDQYFVENFIQFPMITEILAQFMSVFNSLLTIGIVAKILAQSKIVEDIGNIYLKEYYKKTAVKLCHKRQQEHQECVQKCNIYSKICDLQKAINDTNFVEQQKKFFNIGFVKKMNLFLRNIFSKKNKISSEDEIIYKRLNEEIAKKIDVYEVYKDLINLKMTIKLMLSKEQYAAIQFCGCDFESEFIEFQEKVQNQNEDNLKINKESEDLKIIQNHLEEVNQIENSYNKKKQFLQLFIENSKNKTNPSNLDRNILDCLIDQQKYNFNQEIHSKKLSFGKIKNQSNVDYLNNNMANI